MTADIKGLSGNACRTAISELNARLADGLALAMALKQAHWNVKGPNFIAVHGLFDTVYANLQTHLDIFTERVQVPDGVAEARSKRLLVPAH